jgi:hypothetical protein
LIVPLLAFAGRSCSAEARNGLLLLISLLLTLLLSAALCWRSSFAAVISALRISLLWFEIDGGVGSWREAEPYQFNAKRER